MMTPGSVEVTEILHVLLAAQNEAKTSDDESSSGSGLNVTDAGVQTDGPNECYALGGE